MHNGELESLRRENETLKEKIERLTHDLIHDELTGLKTRRYIVDEAKRHIKLLVARNGGSRRLDQSPAHAAFLFCDIDRFKSVNDSHGHGVGDEVLRQVSRVLAESLRESDTVARFGGEEILIFLTHVDRTSAQKIAEKLRVRVAEMTITSYPGLRITVSIGVASTEDGLPETSAKNIDTMFDEYIRRADMAVYAAKHAGRDRVIVWSPELQRMQHNAVVRIGERKEAKTPATEN